MTTIIITLVIVNIVVLIHNNLETMKTIDFNAVIYYTTGTLVSAYVAFAFGVATGIIRF